MALSAGAASTESELLYDLALPEIEAGAYSVCYCDDQKDKTLEDMGDGDTTYHLYDDNKCTGLPRVTEPIVVAEKALPEHQCEAKSRRAFVHEVHNNFIFKLAGGQKRNHPNLFWLYKVGSAIGSQYLLGK